MDGFYLFNITGMPREKRQRFFRYAAACGADRQLIACRCQFARMPNAMRDNGCPQNVVLFNPFNLTI